MSDPENSNKLLAPFEYDVDIGLLIKLVQNFPYLYNNRLVEFKNITLKERTWSKIAITLKAPVEDCRRVWKNVRDKYGKETRHYMEHPGSSKWEFYDSLHFLKHVIKRRRRARKNARRFQCNKIEYKEESTEEASNDSHAKKTIWEPIEVAFSPKDISILESEVEDNLDTEEITLNGDMIDELPIKQISEHEDTVNIVRYQTSEEAFGAYVASRLLDFDINVRQSKKVKIFKILEDLDELC
ncbi:unnamed protein product [Psylliodes chrysocephalus]|uniref:MADF domain-containing protein n=1 Tax=Psylliodes chrysocephalus TaxID=3402493 RepID=A0A9P0G6X9_9CUCU|nr:unnamed protein product [Psylliodes chrysocephala]